MPKPVLSDSLFNADDVATAILEQANLSVTNQDFAVSDKSSIFTRNTGWNDNGHSIEAYSFNGFMFVSFNVVTSSLDTSVTEHTIYTITDSNFNPDTLITAPTVGYQSDTAYAVNFKTDGTISVSYPTNAGFTSFHVVVNSFYRY